MILLLPNLMPYLLTSRCAQRFDVAALISFKKMLLIARSGRLLGAMALRSKKNKGLA